MTTQSNRVYLRGLKPSDVNDKYYSWMNNSDVIQYTESRYYPNTIERINKFITSINSDPNSMVFAIVLKKNDQHIGNIKIGPINWIHRNADIGIIIGDETCWGKGYGSEAIDLVVGHAFNILNLHKLTAGYYSENIASEKIFHKNKFQIEGTRKDHAFFRGEYVDVIQVGLVNPEGTK